MSKALIPPCTAASTNTTETNAPTQPTRAQPNFSHNSKIRWTESQSELRHQTRRNTVSCSRKHWSPRVQRLAPTLPRPMPQPHQRGHNQPFATVRIEIPNIGEGRGACKFSGTNNQPPPAPQLPTPRASRGYVGWAAKARLQGGLAGAGWLHPPTVKYKGFYVCRVETSLLESWLIVSKIFNSSYFSLKFCTCVHLNWVRKRKKLNIFFRG